jgi:hypothetical protein
VRDDLVTRRDGHLGLEASPARTCSIHSPIRLGDRDRGAVRRLNIASWHQRP